MTIINIDPDFFYEIAKLPSEVIALILGLLPKCMLPKLLYFPPIKEIVVSTIFTDVNIIEETKRHKGSDGPEAGYSECHCDRFDIRLDNLIKGVNKCNIYPRSIHIHQIGGFQNEPDTFLELLKNALCIEGKFSQTWGLDPEILLDLFVNSNVKFDHLELFDFPNPVTLPHIAASITLYNTELNNYAIPGIKKLIFDVESDDDRNQTYTFSSDLEELYVTTDNSIEVTLPPNLRKLRLYKTRGPVDLVSEELVNLEYLLLMLPNIQSFSETGINAPNLKKLILECGNLSNFDGLKQFQHLKDLEFRHLRFPITLFDDGSLPELESFACWGCSIYNTGDVNNSLSIFPPNLMVLQLEICSFENTEFSNWVLPNKLEALRVYDLPFKNGYLGENLKHVFVRAPTLTFANRFRIFPRVEKFIMQPEYLNFESLDFMYHLPNNLIQLHLIPYEQGKMSPLTKMVKWPRILCDIAFENFNIDHSTLELLNLKESNLEIINICGGDVKKLNADLFPVSVKDLSLRKMGIQKLSDSFENLENLRRLSLEGNQLRKVDPVKLPVSSLQMLNLNECNLRLISPFLVSMLEQKNRNPKLKIIAWRNTNVSVTDIRTALKSIKGLFLDLNDFDKTLTEISKRSSRLVCKGGFFDPRFKKTETDDLYDGSESSLDEEDVGGNAKRRREM